MFRQPACKELGIWTRNNIPLATEWLIKQRWRYLVNRLRVPESLSTNDYSGRNEFRLLAEMNESGDTKNYPAPLNVDRSKGTQPRSIESERFIGELSVVFFLRALRSGERYSVNKLSMLWRKAISETLLIYSEACVLELLNNNTLSGRIAVASLAESVDTVLAYRGQPEHRAFLDEDDCMRSIRACFGADTDKPAHVGIASGVSDEHFPFLDKTRDQAAADESIAQRFFDYHENIIAALHFVDMYAKPLAQWFFDFSETLGKLDSSHAQWAKELHEAIFSQTHSTWVIGAKKLIDVMVAREALLDPSSQRSVRPVRPIGHYWHVVDLAAREFRSSIISRSQRATARTANLKAVWLQRRVEWVWWQSLFGSAATLNAEVLHGLRRRNISVGQQDGKPLLDSRIEQIILPAADASDESVSDQFGARVTVFGGGIAGLTAAHELVERGFDVLVVERQPAGVATREENVQVGGLARTQWDGVEAFEQPHGIDNERRQYPRERTAAARVPGEHGYRFFPSFYRHIFDTMKRTPIRHEDEDQVRPPHLTAFDQLQGTYEQVFARKQNYVNLSRTRPRTLESLRKEYMQLVDGLGFKQRDIARFLFKLIRYLMTCSERREAEYEELSMLEFFGGEDFYHEEFLAAIRAAPQALVAMDAAHGDARTQLNVYLQLLMDQVLGGEYTDNTLRGPTSDAWFVYWREYLEEMGVSFVQGNLLSIAGQSDSAFEIVLEWPEMEAQDSACPGQHEVSARIATSDYVVMALDALEAERVSSRWASNGVPADLRRYSSYTSRKILANTYRYELVVHCKDNAVDLPVGHDMLVWLLSRIHTIHVNGDDGLHAVRSVLSSMLQITGEVRERQTKAEDLRLVFWMAQKLAPRLLRQIESFVAECLQGSDFGRAKFSSDAPEHIDQELTVETPRIPTTQFGDDPADRFQTFTGIQYYFEQDFRLVRGHVYLPDTDWGLSVISQKQFWSERAREVDGVKLRGILSVDIGDTRKVSAYTGKSFLASGSKQEVAAEVWRQIEDSLRAVRGENATVTNLPLPKPKFFHVDEGLEFDGHRLNRNLTPFLVNNVGDWEKRPKCMPWIPGTESKFVDSTDAKDVWHAPHGGYRVHNNRVVFCGHYMRTFTRMTTMEAANESARHAVNAILDHLSRFGLRYQAPNSRTQRGSIFGDYCDIWDPEMHELEDFDYFKRIDKLLFERNKPHLADILRFDEFADVLHPEPSDLQALLAAVGSSTTRDLGLGAHELIGMASSLIKASQNLNQNIVGSHLLPGSNLIEPINNALLNELERLKN